MVIRKLKMRDNKIQTISHKKNHIFRTNCMLLKQTQYYIISA